MIIFWVAFAAIIVFFLQAKIFHKYALRQIGYERQFQKRVSYRGETIELVEQLTNAKWLPVPWMRVESQLSSDLRFHRQDNLEVSSGKLLQNHKSFFTLMPYTKITRRHRIVCQKRGWYKLQSVTMTAGDLLGFLHQTKQIGLNGELIVYPTPAEVPVHELPSHSWQGELSVRRWIVEDPFVVMGTREYRSGDTYKMVNWKATARTGNLQVHQYDYTADRRLMVYLNSEDNESMWRSINDEELIEHGIEWAAGAAQAVIQGGMEAGFCTNMPIIGEFGSTFVEPRSGGGHLTDIFEVMAKLELVRTEPFADLLTREADSGYSQRDVLVISSFWNDQLELQADRLRRNGNAVVHWKLTTPNPIQEQAGEAG